TVLMTFTATDNCANVGTASKSFTLNDTTLPAVSVPSAFPTRRSSDLAAVTAWAATASATDNCSGSPSVSPSYSAPADSCNRTVRVALPATDRHGNVRTASRRFTVNDTTLPVVSVPRADLSLQCFDAAA